MQEESSAQFHLSSVEVRVLGALIEKDMSTPEYYPLSLNALVNACNQKSNRDPVVSYDSDTVVRTIDNLRAKKFALVTTGPEHRVPKYKHRLSETLNLGNRELAILCELMLRGPQTIGELKARAQRLYNFDDLGSVESALNRLLEWQPEPLVTRLARQPGSREPRYAHLLSGEIQPSEQEVPVPAHTSSARQGATTDRITALETEIDSLKRELADLRREFNEFRKQLE